MLQWVTYVSYDGDGEAEGERYLLDGGRGALATPGRRGGPRAHHHQQHRAHELGEQRPQHAPVRDVIDAECRPPCEVQTEASSKLYPHTRDFVCYMAT